MKPFTLLHGDCLELLKTLPDSSLDSVVTDPPYGLSFMGKKWDYDVPSIEIWAECLRVLKPGGHLLAFAGTRTQHRMAVRIEDAGFEIRDTLLDLIASDSHVQRFLASLNDEQQRAFGACIAESSFGGLLAWLYGSGFPKSHNLEGKWEGWGTALKPAMEPITLARKPIVGTVAANVQTYGTGALNINACRIPTDESLSAGSGGIPCRHDVDTPRTPRGRDGEASAERRYTEEGGTNFAMKPGPRGGHAAGRWPANVMHDGSDEVLTAFPDAPGQIARARTDGEAQGNNIYDALAHVTHQPDPRGDTGCAVRFFYCAKASQSDRNEGCEHIEAKQYSHDGRQTRIENAYQRNSSNSSNSHPTVKPTDLMRYLCRLVTPPGGTVLDPFMGSGSTGKAAVLEFFNFIGIEREADYVAIAQARIAYAMQYRQQDLFAGSAA